MRIALFILSFCFVFCSSAEVLGRKGEVEIHVKDHFGTPVSGAEVKFGSRKGFVTDSKGKVTVDGLSEEKTYKVKVVAVGYRDYETEYYFHKRRSTLTIELGWSMERWSTYTGAIRSEEMQSRQSIIDTMDFSGYADCDDTTGTHFYMEAEFPGGQELLSDYVIDMIVYPETSIDMDEQGKVYISFVVEKDGSLSNIKIERGVSRDLDGEAKRIIQLMPKWIPGYCNGEEVRVRCTLPISFTLN